jgi:hypothetical protein
VRSFGVDTYEETFRRRLLKIHELGIKRAFASGALLGTLLILRGAIAARVYIELKFLRILQFMSSRLIPQDASLVYVDDSLKMV